MVRECPSCCVSCEHYQEGEGDKYCLRCKEIESLIPSNETAKKKHVYMPYPPELKTQPDYGKRIDTVDSVSKLTQLQLGVICGHQHGDSWGEIGKRFGICRQNAKRTFKRAMRRLDAEEKD